MAASCISDAPDIGLVLHGSGGTVWLGAVLLYRLCATTAVFTGSVWITAGGRLGGCACCQCLAAIFLVVAHLTGGDDALSGASICSLAAARIRSASGTDDRHSGAGATLLSFVGGAELQSISLFSVLGR